MSEEKNFDQMIDETIRTIHTGEIVEGTVLDVKPDYITINIHYKYDGIITKDEYSNNPGLDLTTAVSVGDTIEAKVMRIQDNEVQLSYKRISEERANKRIEEAFENKEVLTVTVDKITSGGLITSFEGASIFVPASLVSDTYEKNLDKYLGQEIEVVVTEFNPRKRRVIGDRRKLVRASRAERAKELLETLKVGDVLEGEVKSVTAFGAFIDLGGVDGLLHISEMSWGRVESPKSLYKVNDTVRVFIKNIEDGKIALSGKFPDENPWELARDKYQPGTIVTGKVARMTDFGAFIELEPGLDALLHVSQISRKHVKKPSDVLKQGQIIEAKVVDFKEEEKKISLSRRDFEDDLVPDEPVQEEAAQAAAEEVTQEAAQAAEEAAQAPAEAVEEAAQAVEEVAQEAAEAAEEVTEAVQEAAEEVPEAAAEAAEEIAEQTTAE